MYKFNDTALSETLDKLMLMLKLKLLFRKLVSSLQTTSSSEVRKSLWEKRIVSLPRRTAGGMQPEV